MGSVISSNAAPHDTFDRRLGAIMGAALGDAAAMPLHWIYNVSDIDAKLGKFTGRSGQRKDSIFFSPPSCPYYHYDEGENTPYGQQNRVILKSLAEEGKFDP